MRKLIKNLKWMVIPSALMLLLLSMGVVNAGGRWSGIDPVLIIDGETVNIWIEWEEKNTCLVDSVDVFVEVPEGMSVELISESAETFACDRDFAYNISTLTTLSSTTGRPVIVSTQVNAPESFRVATRVYVNSVEQEYCRGKSNVLYSCSPINLDSEGTSGGSGGGGFGGNGGNGGGNLKK